MHKVVVRVDGGVHSAEIDQDTYKFFRDGSLLRQCPIQFYLERVVREYGELTQENINKFMEEKWVL